MEHGKALKHQCKPTDLSSTLDLTLQPMDKVAQGVEGTIAHGFAGRREMQHGFDSKLQWYVSSRRREMEVRFVEVAPVAGVELWRKRRGGS
jgi:hypothetical protein